MNNSLPKRGPDDIIEYSGTSAVRRAFQERFNTFLRFLGSEETKENIALKDEVQQNYHIWAERFELMKVHFSEVWDLFGKIEGEVPGWYRAAPHEGQWGYLGYSKKYGYRFSASIEKNKKRNAAYASKWLWVHFAWGVTGTLKGMGDERAFGRVTDVDPYLVGLDACTGLDLETQLKQAKRHRELVEGLCIHVGMHDEKIGQRTAKIEVASLHEHTLKELCQRLFIMLNNDRLEDFGQALPGVATPGRKLLAGNG